MSESTEMYLLTIERLGETGQPVAIGRLAQELAISPISANQMCRKLADRGLLAYRPYRGVTLTRRGAGQAARVLRHRRLWEVFLVQHLGLTLAAAEDGACQLEHATSEALADGLAAYLGQPARCPHGRPIPARRQA